MQYNKTVDSYYQSEQFQVFFTQTHGNTDTLGLGKAILIWEAKARDTIFYFIITIPLIIKDGKSNYKNVG